MSGKRLSADVWVNVGDFREPDWHRWTETEHQPELLVRPEDPIDRLDLRCLLGLRVTLFFAAWDARVAALYERLQEYADEIAVLSPCFELDCGWYWVRGFGRIEIGDRWRVDAIRAAQSDCTAAAMKRDQAAYANAQAREVEALGDRSWQH
jgi:hypothetical protein